MKKQERGHHEAYVDTWAKITVLKWYDNNVVRIGSNFQGAAPVSFVERFSREKKKKVLISRPAVVLIHGRSRCLGWTCCLIPYITPWQEVVVDAFC